MHLFSRSRPVIIITLPLLLILSACAPGTRLNEPASRATVTRPDQSDRAAVHQVAVSATDVATALRAAGVPEVSLEEAEQRCEFPILKLSDGKSRAAGGLRNVFVDLEGRTGNQSAGLYYANGLRVGTERVAEPLDLEWFLSLEFPVDMAGQVQVRKIYRTIYVNGVQGVGKDSIVQSRAHSPGASTTSPSPGLAVIRWQQKEPSTSNWLVYTVTAQDSTINELMQWVDSSVP